MRLALLVLLLLPAFAQAQESKIPVGTWETSPVIVQAGHTRAFIRLDVSTWAPEASATVKLIADLTTLCTAEVTKPDPTRPIELQCRPGRRLDTFVTVKGEVQARGRGINAVVETGVR